MEAEDSVMNSLVPMQLGVGAPEDVDNAAWEAYFTNLRNSMVLSWNRARDAYLTLKKVREIFGLPLIVAGGEATSGGALTVVQNQQFLELAAANTLMTQLIDEALAGRRKIFYLEKTKDFGIEAFDTDTIIIETQGGRARLVDKNTGQLVNVTGEISEGTLGLHPLIWVAAGVLTLAAVASQYFQNEDNNETARVLADSKVQTTLAEKQAEMVSSGKATPEEAKKMTDAIYIGATNLETARGITKEKASATTGLQSTIKTVMWVALGIGVLYFLARVVPVIAETGEEAAEAA